ncbi:MAG: nucleotidyltransferase family protein, partial [Candidatus Sulfobium sp.]
LDWKFISEAAHSHNISPLLYYNLKGLSNSSLIPATAMKDLKNVYHETTARNMFMYAELQTILDAFHSAGSEAIVLKGAALAGVVYPDIGLRPMLDIDLLVKEGELAVADKVMTGLDYSAVDSLYMENHFHLPPYRHVRKPAIVEIHWHFTGDSRSNVRKWWERAKAEDLMGYRILVPSPEDMLIHLSVHLFNHGYDNGFVLRGLCDIFEALRHYEAEIDWKLLQDEIREQGIEKQVHSILQLARKFYAPLDGSFIPINLDHADYRFLQVLEGSLFVDSGDAPINPHLLKSMMFDNFPKRITYLLSTIFPSRQQMAERYPASPSSMMMFFYYLVRPFHLLARYGKSAARIFRTGRNGRNDGEL